MTDYKPEDYLAAPHGDGPLANSWKDKPHWVLFDCADDLKAAHDRIKELEKSTPEETTITDVVFLREFEGDDIFAVFPAYAACVGRPDLMVCYGPACLHGSASYDYCNECAEVTDPDEYAELFNELECAGYELYVIRKDRYNTFKYAANRKQEAGLC